MDFGKKIAVIEKVLLAAILVFSILGGAFFGYIISEIRNYSGINNLKRFQPNIPTSLYDVNGELIAELFLEKRQLVSYEELPQSLINAFLAAEDKGFYEHFGINPMAILRASGKNFIASVKNLRPTVVQGGSTITQQLAKRLFTSGKRTITRKILEAMLSFQIEKRFTKDEILEMYFNQIYLGHGCHGIATAAEFYFDKDVRHLSVAESAVLAALPSKPNGYSPLKNTREAYAKHRDTLDRMVDAGFLDWKRADRIYREFWPDYIENIKLESPSKTALSKDIDRAPFFTDYVRQILIARYGEDFVYNEGLSVYTTLNLKRQLLAEKYLQDGLVHQNEVSSLAYERYSGSVDRELLESYNKLRMLFSLPAILVKDDVEILFKKEMADNILDSIDGLSLIVDTPQCNAMLEEFRNQVSGFSSTLNVEGAIIAIEPRSGYITSMVGGSEFSVSNQYNRAVQARRQPGSAFKPFVYGSGMEARLINPGMALPDTPIVDIDEEGETWEPGNYEGEFSGMVRLRNALASSINIISVRIYDIVGPEKIIDYASRMLKMPLSYFHPNPSLALGATELTPMQMCNAYAIYANGGKDVIPFTIRYILNRDGKELANIEEEVGKTIASKKIDGSIQIIPENVAYVMTSMMRDVIDRGTANETIRRNAGFTLPAAGKTGTTQNWTDAWFCGFTPDIATVVWVGYDQPFMSLGKHQAGSAVAAPIWANYMKDVYNGMPDPVFPDAPPGVMRVEICRDSGLLPSEKCSVMSEIMIPGSEPTETCDGNHYKMKSVLEKYMENEGLVNE
ncbi:MAG TPA: PBP1A family penicillin-binding protein [Spirochaetota bacterium]|nr:PBP1A family penicillin-binding protein [Spirochaetota bacterium]HPI89727.1 PBP1A family penicillin-binding protein [Spirochaetota bacterium]HPR46640.1 PBP1A family penicillin-binding protein [Spirochaetota bacterium]